MEDLKTTAIQKLARQLKNLNCEFMIVPETGDKLINGNFTHYQKAKHGDYTAHIKQFIDPLAPGQHVDIPLQKFSPASIQSTVSAYCSRVYGKGSHVSRLDVEKGIITVLCLDRNDPDDDVDADFESL